MPRRLPQKVRTHLEKCKWAALAAVETYNRPNNPFRSALYTVLITIAWTALFHAVFHKRGRNPWYRRKQGDGGRGVRYVQVDGDPKHWELGECLKQYFRDRTTPVRKNLEFLIGLRNKIEHRQVPELDPSLYGECQATLMNLESMIVEQFGQTYALTEQLAVSLQFSQSSPAVQQKAIRNLVQCEAKTVTDYIERFRGRLSPNILNSQSYSYSVFLVPKLANRESAADVAVQFVHIDEASDADLKRLSQLNVLIKDKHIPIANLDLYRPSQVVEQLDQVLPVQITMHHHTMAWKYFRVRPPYGASRPKDTQPVYCVYDEAHGDYLYTQAWIDKLAAEFSTEEGIERVLGQAATQG